MSKYLSFYDYLNTARLANPFNLVFITWGRCVYVSALFFQNIGHFLHFDDSVRSGVEVDALVTAQELHEASHVVSVELALVVDIEVLPGPVEELTHVVIDSGALEVLVLLDDHLRGTLRLLLVHLEGLVGRAISVLALKGEVR